jgi:hypothetical protein
VPREETSIEEEAEDTAEGMSAREKNQMLEGDGMRGRVRVGRKGRGEREGREDRLDTGAGELSHPDSSSGGSEGSSVTRTSSIRKR